MVDLQGSKCYTWNVLSYPPLIMVCTAIHICLCIVISIISIYVPLHGQQYVRRH